jgi:hypothetical protein
VRLPDVRALRLAVSSILIAATLLMSHADIRAEARTRPTAQEISQAVAQLKADPNLSGKRTLMVPRWNAPDTDHSWLRWLLQLMRYLAQSSRALLYVALFAAAIALLVYFIRTLAAREGRADGDRLVTPTHVHDLDIRPESLPANIGAAARQLWDSGQHRAALALLYRGLLSRLVHVHHVAIRDSTTEGDCLALTGARLTADRHQFSSRLVRVWQRAVYGGSDPETAQVYDLCDSFATNLDAPTWVPASAGTVGSVSTRVTP